MVEKLQFSSTFHNKIAILGGICWDNRYASTSTAGFHLAIPTSRQVQKLPSKTSFTLNDGQIIYVETRNPWQWLWLWRGMWGTAPQSIGYPSGLRANAPAPLCRPRARLGVCLKVGGDLKRPETGQTWHFEMGNMRFQNMFFFLIQILRQPKLECVPPQLNTGSGRLGSQSWPIFRVKRWRKRTPSQQRLLTASFFKHGRGELKKHLHLHPFSSHFASIFQPFPPCRNAAQRAPPERLEKARDYQAPQRNRKLSSTGCHMDKFEKVVCATNMILLLCIYRCYLMYTYIYIHGYICM